jgi:hypothetical protein
MLHLHIHLTQHYREGAHTHSTAAEKEGYTTSVESSNNRIFRSRSGLTVSFFWYPPICIPTQPIRFDGGHETSIGQSVTIVLTPFANTQLGGVVAGALVLGRSTKQVCDSQNVGQVMCDLGVCCEYAFCNYS